MTGRFTTTLAVVPAAIVDGLTPVMEMTPLYACAHRPAEPAVSSAQRVKIRFKATPAPYRAEPMVGWPMLTVAVGVVLRVAK